VLKISSFMLMLWPTSFCDASLVLNISNFVLMLLRCQLRAEYLQLSADVDDAPAFML
jgi:hypothetical protein